jgi:hypothetical protein
MIPVITYLLCVYLVFKGVEIFQVALMSSRPDRKHGLLIGAGALSLSVLFAILFALWITDISLTAGNPLPRLP